MGKQKSKAGLGERICNRLGIAPEILPNKTVVELHGESVVKIQGGGRILLYTDTEIKIKLKGASSCILVCGVGLSCTSYNKGAVGIEGKICSVSFCREA